MSHGADAKKSIFLALGANLLIALSKLVAAIVTGSGSLLAEAIHSFADSGNQGLLLLGLRRAERGATPEHPLGHGKAIYFWSFLVAILLFGLGGLFSVYEGIHKLRAPDPLELPWLALGILLFAIVLESISLAGCLREVNKVRQGRSLWRWFRETRQSDLLVVFGEDVAALAGLAFAAVAVALTMVTGEPAFDAWGSIVIGALLMLVAVGVAVEVKSMLIGESVSAEDRQAIAEFLTSRPEVKRLLGLITLQLGSEVMVAVKAEMREASSADDLVSAINRCEAALHERFPAVRWSFFEPDVK